MGDMATSKKRQTNKRPYWVVQIEFIDHARCAGNNTGPVKCLVWGLLYDETPTHYKVCSWASGCDLEAEDTDTYAILKIRTLKIRRLSRVTLWDIDRMI